MFSSDSCLDTRGAGRALFCNATVHSRPVIDGFKNVRDLSVFLVMYVFVCLQHKWLDLLRSRRDNYSWWYICRGYIAKRPSGKFLSDSPCGGGFLYLSGK